MARSDSLRIAAGAVLCVVCGLLVAVPIRAAGRDIAGANVQTYEVIDGTLGLRFDPEALAGLGFSFVPLGEIDADSARSTVVFEIDAPTPATLDTIDGVFERFGGGKLSTCGALLVNRPGDRIVIGNLALGKGDNGALQLESTLDPSTQGEAVFDFASALVELDRVGGQLRLDGELAISSAWANKLGMPDAAGTVVGAVLIDAKIAVQRAGGGKCAAVATAGELGAGIGGTASEGSDIIVADLQSSVSYPTPINDPASFGIGTLACNLGTQRANWIANTNQHPVIVQNLFRLKQNHFEQIGMAWVKHGFYAVSESFCTTCLDPTNGTALGVGCSDPYSASLNVVQNNMSPRYLINAHTGFFVYPWGGPGYTPGTQERRLLVNKADLDPALNTGARYFMEGHYVHPDDCRANTQDNNASYREVMIANPSAGQYGLTIVQGWATQRGQAAIRAWKDADSAVLETDVRVPGEGLFILAAKVAPTGTGTWRYNYALQNLNSDRSGRTFSIQLPPAAILTNVGFHDVAYHSGEPISHDPWQTTITSDSITWSTATYEANPNANALRYDTIYNFYFDANVIPDVNKATIGLFKSGSPTEVAVTTRGPKLEIIDCNHNGIPDACDLDCGAIIGCLPWPPPLCGQSIDCNGNGIPDECEDDCNHNGIADECDIRDCPPGDLACGDCDHNGVPDGCQPDCNGNGIPDACDPPVDTDGDGITDCFDLCPTTTPAGSCLLPPIVGCFYPQPWICVPNYPLYACIGQGGVPRCSASEPGSCDAPPCPDALCRFGCLLGDYDRDGNNDLRDYGAYQNCFSGQLEAVGFVAPSHECTILLDFDEDGDIDAEDYTRFEATMSGP